MLLHVCFCYNRFQVGEDGKTPYSRTRGKDFDRSMVEFGERVLYQKIKNTIGPNLNQAETRAEEGLFLGVRARSHELFIGTSEGVIRVRTLHRVLPASRWKVPLFESFRGLPWDHEAPALPEPAAEEQLQPQPEQPDAEPSGGKAAPPENINPRDFKILQKDLQKYGYTSGCPGCLAARLKQQAQNHNTNCRNRIKQELLKTDEGRARVEAAAARMLAGPRARAAEPDPQPLGDEDRADQNIPEPGPPAEGRVVGPNGREIVPVVGPNGQELFPGASSDEEGMDVGFLANLAIAQIQIGMKISEVYSPPRVAKLAKQIGMQQGFSIDLREVDPDDGKPWNLSNPQKRAKIEQRVREEKPLLLIGCPPCTAFCTLFASNISRMNPTEVQEKIAEALVHLNFCLKLYQIQIEGNRYFLHEHPWGAWSWKTKGVLALLSNPSVRAVKGHMCTQGMYVSQNDGSNQLAFKPTGWMSNSPFVLEELNKQCTNLKNDPKQYHKHANLQNGHAAEAAVYPEQLCFSILRGMRRQLIELGVCHVGEIGTICEDLDEHKFMQEIQHYTSTFYDNVSGKPLDPKLVTAARAEEIRGINSHKVWTKVPIQEAYDKTGKAPVGTKWVDINKGDETDPNYRCRLVGQEFKGKDTRDDLFAATPPLEAIKVLISMAASQRGAKKNLKKLMFIDISKAYFHAPSRRPVYVKLPAEALEPGELPGTMCGKLNYSLYGTRDAAQNWEEEYTAFLVALGFQKGLSSPCLFRHRDRDVDVVVHGDDFTMLGQDEHLRWLKEKFAAKFKIKVRGILGPDESDDKEISLLNRAVSWNDQGITYEADQRHPEILLKLLNYENVKGVATPGQNEIEKEFEEGDDDPLPPAEASLYRASAARCNFLGLDRPDIQYAAKEISRSMSSPCRKDVKKLHRMARYLKAHPRLVLNFPHQAKPDRIDVYSDTNWAGCLKTRKSTQGGVVMLGQHCLKTWSSTQAIIALSSGEAEYYGVVKATSTGLGCKSLMADLGQNTQLTVHTDAEAAKGIASRMGLGKTRHIQVHYLWVQERIRNGDLELRKVLGTENPADLLTKHLSSPDMLKYLSKFGAEHRDGRASVTPTV